MATSSLDEVVAHEAKPCGGWRDDARQYCRMLLHRLSWCEGGSETPLATLGITSSCGGEGVSTVAAQLAETAASSGDQRVLLVDANPRRPSVHRTFGVDLTPGWADALVDAGQLAAAVQSSSRANLSVVAAGSLNGTSVPPCDPQTAGDLVEALKADFDLVLFDMPPVEHASCAIRLASLLDGVLLVVEAERTAWEVAQRSKQLLTRDNIHLLGAVLNKWIHR